MTATPRAQQGTRPEKPYNAADEEQVAERTATSKVRDDARKEGMRFVMGSPKGRAWVRFLLAEQLFTRVGKKRPAQIFTGNSTTFYNAALKELGDIIAADLSSICPVEFRLMEDEGEPSA